VVDPGQRIERLIESDYLDTVRLRRQERFVERQAQRVASALGRAAPARVIHQDASHDLRAERQEMRPALAADSPGSHQLEIRLIGQGGRFEGLAGPPALEVPVRDPLELRIQEVQQAVQGTGFAAIPGSEHPGDVLLVRIHHAGRNLSETGLDIRVAREKPR
jgi:hypothetical protein